MKKKQQLGMHPSTASGRLVKDILFNNICKNKKNKCFRCGLKMTRNDFSIDHKIAWLDSPNPVMMYFNLKNITFSHLSCNSSTKKSNNKKWSNNRERWAHEKRKYYNPKKRALKYKTKGY